MDGDEASEPEQELAVLVMKSFNPKTRVCTALLSDGSSLAADEYIAGELGFVEAVWWSPTMKHVLEVTNNFLKDGAIMPQYSQPVRPRGQQLLCYPNFVIL